MLGYTQYVGERTESLRESWKKVDSMKRIRRKGWKKEKG